MVWGAFIGSTKSPLVFLDGTQIAVTFIQQLYEPHLCPLYNYVVHAPYIQISNKQPATNQINKLPWPTHSPDLTPIANVWKVLKTCVTKHHQPCTLDKLHMAIQSTWDDVSPTFFEKLLIGMHKRMEAVIESNGGSTTW
ncbi:hypothetical protein O181_067279 [Austropuccinia psidii MF-1]|uniref:Tc1-like transposase DDE domain-containing protein n=1 Tax=Austropuccinia psidii MF-1 TaxID=1389203 RepID=A0A9Q3EUL8_9BASI|nr:hypothetical protein [Austropuccinia psidii MF-1]